MAASTALSPFKLGRFIDLANLTSGYSATIVRPGKQPLAGIRLRFQTILGAWGIDRKENH
jgi:hypothetical protein